MAKKESDSWAWYVIPGAVAFIVLTVATGGTFLVAVLTVVVGLALVGGIKNIFK
jgi:hypothetical protein